MTVGQRFARLATGIAVRSPRLWWLVRGRLTRSFDRLAPEWDATRVDEARLRTIATALEGIPEPPARVLDVGTGTGAVARIAAARWPGAQVTGVDISGGMVAEAERLASTGREHYLLADSSSLPFPDGSFDAVTMNNAIPFFDELARVVAPGGHLAIAYSRGPRTPIWVPLDRVRAELERRGFEHVADYAVGEGLALVARKA